MTAIVLALDVVRRYRLNTFLIEQHLTNPDIAVTPLRSQLLAGTVVTFVYEGRGALIQ